MVGLRSSGALWFDVALLGFVFLALLLLYPLVLLTNPNEVLDPNFSAAVLWFTAIGVAIISVGVGIGRRTGWKVPDPKVVKTK